VKESGCALKYAHADLRKDKKVVLAAVNQDGWVLAYASSDLKNNKAVMQHFAMLVKT
jgi:hypothetical protein|tara:strand:- start:423 stop:593 length:171 start_codon:yes stop_codon:yes gene_type:complete